MKVFLAPVAPPLLAETVKKRSSRCEKPTDFGTPRQTEGEEVGGMAERASVPLAFAFDTGAGLVLGRGSLPFQETTPKLEVPVIACPRSKESSSQDPEFIGKKLGQEAQGRETGQERFAWRRT
jgi:hypothetical protein